MGDAQGRVFRGVVVDVDRNGNIFYHVCGKCRVKPRYVQVMRGLYCSRCTRTLEQGHLVPVFKLSMTLEGTFYPRDPDASTSTDMIHVIAFDNVVQDSIMACTAKEYVEMIGKNPAWRNEVKAALCGRFLEATLSTSRGKTQYQDERATRLEVLDHGWAPVAPPPTPVQALRL